MSMIVGISGNARTGKDTFAKILINHYFPKLNLKAKQYSFAFSLKKDLEDFLLNKCGVDVWTEDSDIKSKIRDLLVWYGTTWWRSKDPDHWIKILNNDIKSETGIDIFIISDVRYVNEAKWIKSNEKGILIHLSATDGCKKISPANEQEKINDPLLQQIADIKLTWELLHLPPELSYKNEKLINIVEETMNSYFFRPNSHKAGLV